MSNPDNVSSELKFPRGREPREFCGNERPPSCTDFGSTGDEDETTIDYPEPVRDMELKGNRRLILSSETAVMGILNVTPDSFSDGGRFFDTQKAADRALEMIEEGARIIDIGGESTRPGARKVPEEEERKRVIPVIKAVRKHVDIPISIDTARSSVASEAIDCGADIVNDISAMTFDESMPEIVEKHCVPVILMHMKGTPRTMQDNPVYDDVCTEIGRFLKERTEHAVRRGIDPAKIIIDPGIGFGKTLRHNLEIIKNLEYFKVLGRPILIGPSRKSFIGRILKSDPGERLEGTIAACVAAIMNGASIIRVHDVKQAAAAAKMTDYIMGKARN